MNEEQKLRSFKKKIDRQIYLYLDRQIKHAREINPQAPKMLVEIKRFIDVGGKRVRPLFLYLGYQAAGGKDEKEIIKISMVPEFLHTFALMHDDIIDRSTLRRGQPTSHVTFTTQHTRDKMVGEGSHYGLSAAILAGDVSLILAEQIFHHANFPARDLSRAQKYWELMKFEVLHGEYLDVLFSFQENVSKEDIFSVLNYKTAKYTVERPLQIGAALAGASDKVLQVLGTYGSKLGQAFQIKDDISGVFGEEEKIGKSVTSDLVEGKKTLLILETLSRATAQQKEVLLKALGNQNASTDQLDAARQVITATGALAASETAVSKLVEEAKQSLDRSVLTKEGKYWLLQAADYLKLT